MNIIKVTKRVLEGISDTRKDIIDWPDATLEMRSNAKSYIRGMEKVLKIMNDVMTEDAMAESSACDNATDMRVDHEI